MVAESAVLMPETNAGHHAPVTLPAGIQPFGHRLFPIIRDRRFGRVLMLGPHSEDSAGYQFPQVLYDPQGPEGPCAVARRAVFSVLNCENPDDVIEIRETGKPLSDLQPKLPANVIHLKRVERIIYTPVMASLRYDDLDKLLEPRDQSKIWVDWSLAADHCASFRKEVYLHALRQFRDYLPSRD